MSRPALTVARCRWIDVPGARDRRGAVHFVEVGKGLDFPVQRAFWLTDVGPDQWRGRHGHREVSLVLVALAGGCDVLLEDERTSQTVRLEGVDCGLLVGPWVWHELNRFAPGSAVLALASGKYDEADYIRDHAGFRREAAGRAA